MSMTRTTGLKRLIALGASAALTAGVLVPLAATSASAVQSYTVTDNQGTWRYNLQSPLAAPFTLTGAEALGLDYSYAMVYIQGPSAASNIAYTAGGGGIAQGTAVPAPIGVSTAVTTATQTSVNPNAGQLTFSGPGTYTLGVCRIYGNPAGQQCGPGDAIIKTFQVKVGGFIAAFSVNPSSVTAPANTFVTFDVSFTDSAGVATLPQNPTDTLNVLVDGKDCTVAQPCPDFLEADLLGPLSGTGYYLNDGQLSFAVALNGANKSAALNLVPDNNTIAPKTVVLQTVAAAAPATLAVKAGTPNVAMGADGQPPVGQTYIVKPGVTTIPMVTTAAAAGAALVVTTSPASAPSVVTYAAGTPPSGAFDVTIPAASAVAGTTFSVTVTSGGAGTAQFTETRTFIYQASVSTNLEMSPPDGSVVFAPTGGSIDATAMVTDQYGNPSTQSVLVALYRNVDGVPGLGGTDVLIASGQTNADGVFTAKTVPSGAATDSFGMVVFNAGAWVGVNLFTVQYGVTPTVTLLSGVSTASSTVTRYVPGEAIVSNTVADGGAGTLGYSVATAVTAQVSVNGVFVPNAAVGFSGSDGVSFLPGVQPLADAAWDAGVTTWYAKADGIGRATLWAYSTKTGSNTVDATAGATKASGSFTATTQPWFARNVMVEGPASAPAGSISQVKVSVTDNFGNGVANTLVDAYILPSSPGRFTNGNRTTNLATDGSGVAVVEVTSSTNETGEIVVNAGDNPTYAAWGANWAQYGAAANQLDKGAAANSAPGFTASNAPGSVKITLAGAGALQIVSPKQGSAISSGGRFNVRGVTTGLAEGSDVYLVLNYRAKAVAKVEADGKVNFLNIPAEPGDYRLRVGDPGSYAYSDPVALDIRLFSITRFQENVVNDTDNFQIATGNWSPGTKIYLTRNGIAVASVKVGAMGQPVGIRLVAKPGTYQVRVNSNQGLVYGDANGQVVVK